MIFRALVAASAALSAAGLPKPPACTATREFRDAVSEVLRSGEETLRDELFDEIVDVPAPVKSLSMEADRSFDGKSHYFDVLVYKVDGKLKPKGVIVASMQDASGRRERWLMLTDLSGNLKKAVVAWDQIDENGEIKHGTKTLARQKGPYDPEASERLKYELRVDCITRKTHG